MRDVLVLVWVVLTSFEAACTIGALVGAYVAVHW